MALPRSCFAYCPTDNISDCKLRLCNAAGKRDKQFIAMAAAALSPGGFRGNRVQIPSGAIAGAKAKVRAAWTAANPDKKPADMPASIR